jgi:hypothetical protein
MSAAFDTRRRTITLHSIRVRLGPRLQIAIELTLVVMLALFVTRPYQNWDQEWSLAGVESEYLVNSATWLETGLRHYGYIPYWQPYLDRGQPTVDEAYSFLANPFTFYPVVAFGAVNGLKLSVVLYYIVAGVGGWFLGWSLGWSGPARLLAAGLFMLKGNMQGLLGSTYFQLGVTQAYFPWTLAGAMAIVRHPGRRWPVGVLALSMALTFLAGNIYFFLPSVIMCALVFAFYLPKRRAGRWPLSLRWGMLLRYPLAAAFCIGLVAVVALTVVPNYALVRGHPDSQFVPTSALGQPFTQFFTAESMTPTLKGELYSYSAPLWFLLLIFVLLPPIRRLHQPADGLQGRRFWIMLLIGLAFFFSWAVGVNPVLQWMYDNLPLLPRWRFIERMMTLASFFFVALVAYRFDGLYRAITTGSAPLPLLTTPLLRRRAGQALAVAGLAAVITVGATRDIYDSLWDRSEGRVIVQCLEWLRARYPDDFLSVRRPHYNILSRFITLQVRKERIQALYDLSGVGSPVYGQDLTLLAPEYYMVDWQDTAASLTERGYVPVEGAPLFSGEHPTPCVWRYTRALSYAFSVPTQTLRELDLVRQLPTPEMTTPARLLGRTPEFIVLEAALSPDQEIAVVAQDIAYPGWVAYVNDQPAPMVSVGQIVGVILPPGSGTVRVAFEFTAPTLHTGGYVTMATAAVLSLYLLRADTAPLRLWRWQRRRRAASLQPGTAEAAHSAPVVMEAAQIVHAETVAPPPPAPPTPSREDVPIHIPDPPRAQAPADAPERQLTISVPLPRKDDITTLAASVLTAAATALLVLRMRRRR